MKKSPVDLVKKLAFLGKEYDEIIQVLDENKYDFPLDLIEEAKDKIDDHLVAFQLATQEKAKGFNQLIMGGTLFFIGASITGFTYFSNKDNYILAYGAILSGAWIAKEGYKICSKPLEDLVPRKRRILKR